MNRINMNKVAKLVAEMEAGKEEVSIAQIKEILKVYNTLLVNEHNPSEVFEMLERYYE